MKSEEQFAVLLTQAVLTVAEEDIQLAVLEQMVTEEPTKALDVQLTEAKVAGKQAGDFGMEIMGPMLLSALLEAGKMLWSLYLKKLEEKGAAKLADATVEGVKKSRIPFGTMMLPLLLQPTTKQPCAKRHRWKVCRANKPTALWPRSTATG